MAFNADHARRMRQALAGSGRVVPVGIQSVSAEVFEKVKSVNTPENMGAITAIHAHMYRNEPADATFGGSTSTTLTQKVNKIATTTMVISSLNPSTFGQTVTFTATVGSSAGAPPNGEVIAFKNGATALGAGILSGGTTSYSTSSLNAGLRSITASYAGDLTLASSSGSVTQTINSASTSLTLTSWGQPCWGRARWTRAERQRLARTRWRWDRT